MGLLEGKTALVTGGGSGIGLASAVRLRPRARTCSSRADARPAGKQ